MLEILVFFIVPAIATFISEFFVTLDVVNHPKIASFENIGCVFGLLALFPALVFFENYINQLSPLVFIFAFFWTMVISSILGSRFAKFYIEKRKNPNRLNLHIES